MAGADALPLPTGEAADLTTASNALTRVADRVSQTHIYQEGGNSPVIADSWQGGAKDSRVSEANRLKPRIVAASDRLPTIAGALTTYEETLTETIEDVEGWQEEWDEAQETYLNHIRRINDQPWPPDDRQQLANNYADERDAEHERLVRLYDGAMEELEAAGSTAATTIRGECDQVVPADVAGSRTEIGAYLLRDLPLSGGEAMTELANEVAPELVEDLRTIADSNDPEALANFLEQYGEYADDPYFAHAVMSRLEAEGLMGVFQDLAIANMRGMGDDELNEGQREVMAFLGTMYATASGPADGDIDPHGYNYEGISTWREEVWFPSLIESGNQLYQMEDEGYAGGSYHGYWAQGMLLAAGTQAGVTPGPEYMSHVGQDMVAWDRAMGAANDQRTYRFAAPFHEPALLDPEQFAATTSQDPIHALLDAASRDEASTHALLLSEVPGANGEHSVVDYLVRERGGTMAEGSAFMDQGELLARTVAEHGSDRGDEQSTALAGHYLNAYVDTVGSGTFANGTELTEYSFAHGRTATADLMSVHIEDFVRALSRPDDTSSVFGEVIGDPDDPTSYRIHFDEATTRNFARTFGDLALDRPEEIVTADNLDARDNPPALQRVINAAVAHNANALQAAYADPNGAPVTVMDQGAGFLVYLTESSELALTDVAEDADAYGEYLKKVLGAGVGTIPVGKIPVVGVPANAAFGLTADAVLDHLIDTGHADRQENIEAAVGQTVRSLLQEQGETAIIEAGAWEGGKDPVTWAEARDLSPQETFIRDGELMPLEEIRADPRRSEAFFVDYLGAQDGGAEVLRIMNDQVQEAVGSGGVIAADDYHATGG